ncbi:hypothetical protein [Streptomyces sp. UNOC14_S4]|uniref:hypothetical protein n=1 Tax=Streptomyces sp. UNOC14_S4 TaxID=2872340 RepID=UPI001E3A6B36|nr:hypothetical protein [Streptomyces sp. UNOC14_S4]MCC3769359.1 hypothetical protein [Streptomyces sp. UNOC14_S4]
MYVRPGSVALVTLAVSSLLLLSACDGDSGSDSGKKSGSSAKTADKGTPAAPESITAEQAKQALVEVKDLPTGWKAEPNTGLDKSQGADEDTISGVKPLCAPVAALLNTGRLDEDHKANAQAVFTKQGDQTTVAQDVSGYTRPQAEKAMAGLKAAVEQCGTFTGKQGGKPATLTVKKTVQQPKYGDDSVSYTLKVVQGDMQMDFDMGTVRSHGAITTVLNNYSDHGDRGKAAFTKALAKAGEKLTAAAAKTP